MEQRFRKTVPCPSFFLGYSMKKNIYSFYFITLAAFFLSLPSCQTMSEVITFPQKGGNLIYTTPSESKTKEVQFFSIDLTITADEDGIIKSASAKYSISIKNKSKKELEKLKIEIISGNDKFMLSHSTLYIDSFKKSSVLIRLQSELTENETMKIIKSEAPLSLHIFDDDGFSAFIDLNKFKRKLTNLRVYF